MTDQPSASGGGRRGVWILILAIAAAVALGWVTRRWWTATPAPVVRTPEDPRTTFPTPFKNVHPEVKYVGDAACARCHPNIAEKYRAHPMGQSLLPVTAAAAIERFDAGARNPFDAAGFRYRVERRAGHVVHRETALDAQGRAAAETEAEVDFAVGSGRQGRTFLVNRNGYLFESPVTWYVRRGRWDLSPGFENGNHHFTRPITPECLFCHSNYAEHVEGTVNRYRDPIFRGHAIGCERCHGPGELHGNRLERTEGMDPTIVNPRRLEPALRDAVCEQCHLGGEQRVLRRGRETFDYRPGLPLHLFLSVFVAPPETDDENRFLGQVEQMHASRCYQASAGKLGCISCHDPHEEPAPENKAAYFRERCLACHKDRGCRLPLEVRRQTSKDDSCVQCHMPATGSSNIAHVSISDHRIRRRPATATLPPAAGRTGKTSLVHFHRAQVGPGDRDVERDLGIALIRLADGESDPDRQRALTQSAWPLLEAALAADPGDVDALRAKGYALWFQGRMEEAAAAFDTALALGRDLEQLLPPAATLAENLARADQAVSLWRRAIEINPYCPQYYEGLASALAQRKDWRAALEQCGHGLRLNPVSPEMRQLSALAHLRLGETEQAEAEFQVLLRTQPEEDEQLRRWWASERR
jgi:Flp pilus assembly protein TadD